jgi:hypothetical protein
MLNLNPTNINASPVRLSLKRPSEFKNPHSLTVVKEKPDKFAILKPLKQKTRGLFLNDPELKTAIKENRAL